MVAEGETETLILGIGNVLWADEGFGVRCVEALNARFHFDETVRLMDGGTQGLFLLPWVSSVSRLLLFDAIDFGLDPGQLRVMRDDEVPQYLGAKKVSMHQTGFQEVLMSAKLLNDRPKQLALIGVQPEMLDDYGGSLRPSVRQRIPEAIDRACSILSDWGVDFREREDALTTVELIGSGALDLSSYESGKPR